MGLVGSGLLYLQGVLSRDLEQQRFEASLKLEREKFESSIILEAIKTGGDSERAARNLRFFVDMGFIRDPDSRISKMAAGYDRQGLSPQAPALAPRTDQPRIKDTNQR